MSARKREVQCRSQRQLNWKHNEANLSTEQSKAPQDARIPSAHAHDGRPERPEATPQPRSPLSRRLRGPSKKRFDELFQTGRRARGASLFVLSLPGTGLVGIATSKKIGGKPSRNHAKRRVQAILYVRESSCRQLDLAFVLNDRISKLGFQELKEEVERLLREATAQWEENSESF